MENSENVTPTKARKCSITIEVKITPSPKKKKEPQLDIEKALSQMFDNFGDSMANKLSEGNVCEKSKVNTLEHKMKSNKDLLALLQDSPCGKKPEVNEKVVEDKKKKRNLHSLSMSELMHSTPTKKSYEETDEELLSCLDFVFGSPVLQEKSHKKKHSEDDGNDNIEKTVKKNKKQKKINNQMEQDKTEVLDNSLSLDEGVYTENEGSVLSQKVRKKKKHKHLEEEYNTRNEHEETIVSSDYSRMNALENKHVTIRKKKKCKNVNDDGASLNVTEDSDNQTTIKKKTKKTDDESVLSTDYSIQDENISVCDYTVTEKTKSKKKAKLKTDNHAVESSAEMSHSIIDKKKSASAADENEHKKHDETILSSDYSRMNELENNHVTIKKKKKRKNVNDVSASLNVTEDSDNETTIKKKRKKTDDESVLSTDYSIQDENISVCDYTVTKKSKSKNKAKLKTDNQAVESSAEMNYSIVDKKKSASAADENEHKEHDETILSSDYSPMNELENNHVTIKKKKKRKNVNVGASLNVTEDSDNETTIKKKRKKTDDESVLSTDYSIQDDENISVCDDSVTEKTKRKKEAKLKTDNQAVESSADKKGKNEHNSDHNKENVESQDFPTSHTDLSLTKESSTREQDTDSDDADVTTLRVRKATSKNSNNVASKFKKILSKHKCESVKTRPNRVVPRRRKFAVALDSKQPQEQENGETKTAPIEEAPDKSFEELLDDVEDKDVKSRRKYKDMAKLNIFVPYPIPALHRIETRVAGRPTNAQKQQIEDLGVSVKSGNFSQAEDKILRKNWRRFCKMHNMPRDPTPFLNFADVSGRVTIPTIERINFVRFLAHGLENRLLSSVYRRFKRINCNKEQKSGNYTPEEDKVIIDYIQTSSSETPYADLAKLLNRSRISVHKRCTSLGERLENSTRVKWDEVMIEKFIKELKRVTKVEELSEFKDRKITNEEWNTLAERLNLPKTKLQRGWTVTVYPKLFIEKNMKLPSVKKELVALLIERGEKDWRAVNWQEITKSFEGFSALRLNRIMKDLVSYHCPVEIQNNLGASLEYVKDIVNKELKTPLRTTYLKKIQLE